MTEINEILKQLKAVGVHHLKSDAAVMLEMLHDTQDGATIDTLINKLLSSMTSNKLQSILLECPHTLLHELPIVKQKMSVIGERAMYTRELREQLGISIPAYEVWSITEPKAIAFLAEVMNKSKYDAAKYLDTMKIELASQVDNMYTVYMFNNEPVGVVFPHIEPDTNQEGRLFWIGFHPAYKGKGLGRGLHTIGLYRLQHDFQAKSYLGATEIENAPMRKIMEANGCVQQATVVSLKYSIA
ncbi:GNAT family N-acetyltransferase [Paenibacillus sp. chi10]|uniref:GNAT family N-acetyltransferase n=1 Tax=Paenibacillus suaedae TaxID=3077233 RepID=A0AAJ2N1L5_9BACL|nr:GNAT family N-acetyltransferase [Paenibacillus sp. chi10]MDT8976543.1 GNAT family N-acetyltransferase [Paenibacillus sp. chi10]